MSGMKKSYPKTMDLDNPPADDDLPAVLEGKIIPVSKDTRKMIEPLLQIILSAETECQSGQTGTSTATTESYRPYVELGNSSAAKALSANRLVRRDCYDHLLPLVMHKMKSADRVTVEGTPGIGKTLFGFFLLRKLIAGQETVVYWNADLAVMFSVNDKHIRSYGLNHTTTIDGKNWSIGMWDPLLRELRTEVLDMENIYVIHDPGEGFLEGGKRRTATNLVVIVSFGHALVSEWATKGGKPTSLTMPIFTYDEIVVNKGNLFHGKPKGVDNDFQVKAKYERFGGSIRHWGTDQEEEAWAEMAAKIQEVARNDGVNIMLRTTNHRGSIIHVDVDFDKMKPLFPSEGHNAFAEKFYILGSTEVTTQFSATLANLGKAQFQLFMTNMKYEKGGEALYGLLFEIHAHNYLRHAKNGVNFRVVRRDGKNKNQYATVQIPVGNGTLSFAGQEAAGISEVAGTKKRPVGTYILPQSGTFPTYDAAVVVPAAVVGVKDKRFVGLLLQMTVSGATSLRRKPEHVVKLYMRNDMHTALEAAIDGFHGEGVSVTTFCVPSACFHPFLFQMEERKNGDEAITESRQPEFQFVVEIPEFMQLPVSVTPVGEIHGATGRTHRYMFRAGSAKRVKVESIYDKEDDCEEKRCIQ